MTNISKDNSSLPANEFEYIKSLVAAVDEALDVLNEPYTVVDKYGDKHEIKDVFDLVQLRSDRNKG